MPPARRCWAGRRRRAPGAELVRGRRARRQRRAHDARVPLNLTALSLLALLVGMFLIYNTMTFSVVQRRPLIGTLRALGVTRARGLRPGAGRGVVVGALGTAAGLALGLDLATGSCGSSRARSTTSTSWSSVREVAVAGGAAKGAPLGLGATLLAALAPAVEATGRRRGWC